MPRRKKSPLAKTITLQVEGRDGEYPLELSPTVELQVLRVNVANMNPRRLRQFLTGFDVDELQTIRQAIDEVLAEQRQQVIKNKKAKVEMLTQEIEQLRAKLAAKPMTKTPPTQDD